MTADPRPESLDARALWFDAPRSARLRAEKVSPPGPHEARVRAIFSAVSHGTEMLVYRGEVSEELALDLLTLSGGYGFPIKFGYAAVGEIVDAGESVKDLSPGDAVFVHHPHQDVFTVPASMPIRLPDGLDALSGVFFANVETALNIVHDTPVKLGETAAIFGQGVVGLLVTQLLQLAGAGKIIAVEPVKVRQRLSLSLGADMVFEPDEGLKERIMDETDGRGADVAIEVSGSASALQSALDCVALEGTVVAASWYGKEPVSLDLGGHFHRGRVRLRSSQVGGMNPEMAARWDRERRTRTVLDLLPKLRLREMVSHRLPFEEAPEAYRMLDRSIGDAVQFVFEYAENEET